MLRWFLFAQAGLLVATAHADIRWFASLDRARAAARQEQGLLMVYVRHPGERGGTSLDTTLDDPRVQTVVQKLAPVRLDARNAAESIVKRYRLVAYPTVLFTDADGRAVWRTSGPHGPQGFAKQVKKALRLQPNLAKYRSTLASGTGSLEALAGAAVMSAAAGDAEKGANLALAAVKQDPKVKSVTLGDACNLIGDLHQVANRQKIAIGWFQRAAVSPDDDTKAYALISLGTCYMQLRDRKNATIWFKKLAAMGPRAGDLADNLEQLLPQDGARIQRMRPVPKK